MTIVGLYNLTTNQGVALQGVHVEARVVDMIAQVTIVQYYYNTESYPIETKYVFPLDEGAAVTEFEAEVNGKITKAVVKEKQEARDQYNTAVQRGQQAFLLEQEKRDIFEIRVGNIPAQGRANILLSYVVELKVGDKTTRFLLPTAVAPRYSPWTGPWLQPWYCCWSGRFNWNRFRKIHFGEVDYPSTPSSLSLLLEVQTPSRLLDITSGTHHIKWEKMGEKTAVASFSFGSERMDRDVVFQIKQTNPTQARAFLEESSDPSVSGTKRGVAMVTIVPDIEFYMIPSEVVFIVDRSGSVSGSKMKSVREALQLFLRSLPQDCYFNIVSFGSRYSSLFASSTRYDDSSLQTASNHVNSLEANMGGTEILQPLKFVMSQPALGSYSRQIILLTDGEVSNTEELINYVRQSCTRAGQQGIPHTRVFSLGIGSNVSHALVDGIARAGSGTAQYAVDGERLQPKVIRQVKDALSPALRNVKVKWYNDQDPAPSTAESPFETRTSAVSSSLFPPSERPAGFGSLLGHRSVTPPQPPSLPPSNIVQAPYIVPPIFSENRFIAYAFVDYDKVPQQIQITAESPDGPLTLAVDVEKHQGNLLEKLAARCLIRDLEEGSSALHLGPGHFSPEQVKSEMVRVGCKYGLVSQHTSFVGVDESDSYYYRPISQNIYPSNSFSSFAQPMSMSYAKPQTLCSIQARPVCRSSSSSSGGSITRLRKKTSQQPLMEQSQHENNLPPISLLERGENSIQLTQNTEQFLQSPSKKQGADPSDKMQQLIFLQQSDGSFAPHSNLWSLIGISSQKASESFGSAQQIIAPNLALNIWSTALAVAFFKVFLQSFQDEWLLIVNKAQSWIRKQIGSHEEVVLLAGNVLTG